jgi:hypothetical protein
LRFIPAKSKPTRRYGKKMIRRSPGRFPSFSFFGCCKKKPPDHTGGFFYIV